MQRGILAAGLAGSRESTDDASNVPATAQARENKGPFYRLGRAAESEGDRGMWTGRDGVRGFSCQRVLPAWMGWRAGE
jgi:hypothetical protein